MNTGTLSGWGAMTCSMWLSTPPQRPVQCIYSHGSCQCLFQCDSLSNNRQAIHRQHISEIKPDNSCEWEAPGGWPFRNHQGREAAPTPQIRLEIRPPIIRSSIREAGSLVKSHAPQTLVPAFVPQARPKCRPPDSASRPLSDGVHMNSQRLIARPIRRQTHRAESARPPATCGAMPRSGMVPR